MPCQGVPGGGLGESTRIQLGGLSGSKSSDGGLSGLSGDLASLASSLGGDGGKIIVIESDGDEDGMEDDDLASALMDQVTNNSTTPTSGRITPRVPPIHLTLVY